MARYGLKMTIYQLLCFGSSPNLHGASGYIWGHNFWPNQDLDPLSSSKWPLEPQFCERWTYLWQKMARKGHSKVIYKGTFVSKRSLLEKHIFKKIENQISMKDSKFCSNLNQPLYKNGSLHWIPRHQWTDFQPMNSSLRYQVCS